MGTGISKKSTKLSGDLTCEKNIFLSHSMYETIHVAILGKVLIRSNHGSCVLYQQGRYIYIQVRSMIFPNKWVEVTKKFLLAKLYQYFGNFY